MPRETEQIPGDIAVYAAEVRRLPRRLDFPAAAGAVAEITAQQILEYRAHATHLDKRLPTGQLSLAAWGGLQDSAPRAGLLSLHARVSDVPRNGWESEDLIQIWFRGADYIVPREDFPVFTLGCLPRDLSLVDTLYKIASKMCDESRSGDWSTSASLATRFAQVTGMFCIRWDASRTTLIPVETPSADPEDCRLELARRFLHWYAPATVLQFAKWAGVSRKEALETWSGLVSHLETVSAAGFERQVLREDLVNLRNTAALHGIRLLPGSDPYLYLDRGTFIATDAINTAVNSLRPIHPSRLVNSLSGVVMMDGQPIGAWGRVQEKLTAVVAGLQPPQVIERFTAEVETMSRAIGKKMQIRLLDLPTERDLAKPTNAGLG